MQSFINFMFLVALCCVITIMTLLSTPATILTSAAPSTFSKNAKRGQHCDHDKVADAYYNNRFSVTHSYDSGNLQKPFNLETYFIDVECSASGTDDTVNCGKCNNAASDSKMKTFADAGEIATCRPQDRLTDKKHTYITEILDEARAILREIVVAPNFVGGLTPNPGTSVRCGVDNTRGGVEMPVSHQTALPGVHFMLYVTAGPPSRTLQSKRGYSNETINNNAIEFEPLAWAATCGYTAVSDFRPIVGHMHFAPRAIDEDPAVTTSDSKRKKDVHFVLHQIMHVLGWSNPMFRKGTTTTYLAASKSTYSAAFLSSKSFTSGESRNAISSTTVRSEARNHFGCSGLVGAEYGLAQQDSHLVKRIFADDFMSEPLPWDPVSYLSKMSFSFLIDTGFWMVNVNTLTQKYNQSKFGKGKGCNFARDQHCRFPTTGDYDEYCWDSRDEHCNIDLSYGGPCNIFDHHGDSQCVPASNLKYFDSDCSLGGPQVNDYCPTPARVNSYGQCNDVSNNRDPRGAYRLGSSYSNTSRCVQGTMTRVGQLPRTPFLETRCVEMFCGTDRTQTPNNRSLFMKLFNNSVIVKCPELGGTIDVGFYSSDFEGYIVCPVFSEQFCTDNGLIEIGDVTSLTAAVITDTVVFSKSSLCMSRETCAKNAYNNFVSGSDSCSVLSRSIQNCFQNYCDGEKKDFLRSYLSSNCSSSNFVNLANAVCADRVEGAADLCSVVSIAGAGKLMMNVVVVAVMATMILLIV